MSSRASPCIVCGAATRQAYSHPDFRVLECLACSLAFVPGAGERQAGASQIGSTATPEHKLADYAADFDRMKERCRLSMEQRIPKIETMLGRPLERACEVGCSNGVGYFPFHERGITWQGIDADPRWESHGRARGIPIAGKDLDQLEGEFDLIYGHQVLEHIDDPVAFLTLVCAKLRPGGIAHFAVPNHNAFTALIRRAYPARRPLDYGFIQYPYHLRAYTRKSIARLFEQAGVERPETGVVSHYDLCWGEWDAAGPALHQAIYAAGAAAGLGTILYCLGKRPG